MTQLELASLLKLSDRTISKWETGREYPDITFIEKISSTFSISIGGLLCGAHIAYSNWYSHYKLVLK